MFLRAQFHNRLAQRLHRRQEAIGSQILRLLPRWDRGSRDPDDRDLHSRYRLDDVWSIRTLLPTWSDRCVSRNPGKLRFGSRAVQVLETEVVLVVTHCHRIVRQSIHGLILGSCGMAGGGLGPLRPLAWATDGL